MSREKSSAEIFAEAEPQMDSESSEWDMEEEEEVDEEEEQQKIAKATASKAAKGTKKPEKSVSKGPPPPKSTEEEELERLVLGDRLGFRTKLFLADPLDDAEDSLSNLMLGAPSAASAADMQLALIPEADKVEAEDVADMGLFFYEADNPLAGTAAFDAAATAGQRGKAANDAAAWYDSDDERLSVSLATAGRLRKLRRTEGEDIVSGTEYTERLQQQYLRLNPLPAWVDDARKLRAKEQRQLQAVHQGRRSKKTRRTEGAVQSNSDDDNHSDGNDSDASSGSSSSDLSDAPLPLDTFFRSAGAMAGGASALSAGWALGPNRKRPRLRPEVLDIQKTRDIPTQHGGAVTSLVFHPQHPVLMSSSTSSALHLHQMAPTAHPTPNPLLTSLRLRHTPVQRAAFVGPEGRQIVMAGRRRFFHVWDTATGQVQRVGRVLGRQRAEYKTMERFRVCPRGAHLAVIATDRKGGGMLNILDATTLQWVAQARLDSRGGIADFQWWRDGQGLTILGRDGRVGEWCLETRRFVGTWRDEGSTGGTVIALGGSSNSSGGAAAALDAIGGDRWVAVGSTSGIVNVYERTALLEGGGAVTVAEVQQVLPPRSEDDFPSSSPSFRAQPTPTRTFEQLTTPATLLVFSPDSQLLAMASQYKRDALRLVHLPSCTVYRNWPTERTPLGRVTALAFGNHSDLLAVANDVGKTRLWEIRG